MRVIGRSCIVRILLAEQASEIAIGFSPTRVSSAQASEVTVGRIVINPWVGTLLVTSLDVGGSQGFRLESEECATLFLWG